MSDPPLRILFAAPAWWPARAFGGPVSAARELVRRLVERGHAVDVVTTTILDLHARPSARSAVHELDGATVRYLGTPLRYRWMGIAPGLPAALARVPRPDVAHVYGFRDPVTTVAAAWCRLRGIPYVFEPLGMFRPRLRKVALKRALDASVYRGIGSGAAAVVVASARERDDVVACGVPPSLVHVRGIGFPEPRTSEGGRHLRAALGIADGARVILYVGRIAAGKGIEHLLAASRELPDAHVVLLGPDDRHGTAALVAAAGALVHALPASEGPPFDVYPQADVFVLPSAGESFGIAAAEAAAAGTPVVVTDRCGVAGSFAAGEALVVPYEQEAVVGAIRRVLEDQALRARLARGGVDAARRNSWDRVVDRQEAIYRVAASRTAATKLSTLGS